jgi:carbamoyl-phosphate synthase large subunit
VEPVLQVLSREALRIRTETGSIPIVSSPECLAIGDDKLVTCQWLERHGFAFPQYADAKDAVAVNALVEACGYPLIAKPRNGKGAEGIVEVRRETDLRLVAARPGYVIQQYLGDAGQEYTAACFSDCQAEVRGSIVFRRELLGGTTWRAEAGEFPMVRREAVRIAKALRPMGPSNIQMRLHRGRAVCFEINIRFSGTTPIRARFGFNDVEAALRHYVLGEPAADLPLVTQGIALRYWNEAYPDPQAVSELDGRSSLDCSTGLHAIIEDYGVKR